MNIDRISLGKVFDVGKMEYPSVVIREKEIAKQLASFFKVRRNINVILGKVLSHFGFKKDDVIALENIKTDWNSVTFDYLVNSKNDALNKITLKFANLIYKYALVIRDTDKVVTCSVTVINSKTIALTINQIEEKLDNGMIYTRSYNYGYASYGVACEKEKILLEISRKEHDCNMDYLVLENEESIQEYLSRLQFPVDIVEVYDKLSSFIELGLWDTVKISKINNQNGMEVITDMISLNNGVCDKMVVTRGDKIVSVSEDGSCSYSKKDSSLLFTSDNQRITIDILNDLGKDKNDYFENDMKKDIKDANIEIESVKKLVKELFPKRR